MTNSNEKIMRRIEKCLALAGSSNANEAATALRQAHSLMEKHNIVLDDIELNKVKKCGVEFVFNRRKMTRYQIRVVSIIMTAFNVKSYLNYTTNSNNKIVQSPIFYGVGDDAEIAAYVFDVLMRQLTDERKKYLKTLKGYDAPTKNKLADAFCEGWGAEVLNKVHDFAGTMPEDKKQVINKWEDANLGNMRTIRQRRRTITREQFDAINDGKKRGKDVSLFHATGQSKKEGYYISG